MPSLGNGVMGSPPNNLATLVSFSQKSVTGAAPSGTGAASSSIGPTKGCVSVTRASPAAASSGLSASALTGFSAQDQVLRNQAVGRTCSCASSGPALVTSIVIKMSSGPALAYRTSTIQ